MSLNSLIIPNQCQGKKNATIKLGMWADTFYFKYKAFTLKVCFVLQTLYL